MGRRSNFALDEETVARLQHLADRHEQQFGFRPSMAEIVRGLVMLAARKDRGNG